MKAISNSLTYFFLILLLSGCERSTVFHSYQTFTADGWKKNAEITFHPDTLQENSICKVSIELRNKANYPYRDIWLVVSQNAENTKNIVSDTLHYNLLDSRGYYKGKGIGDMYEISFPYKTILFRKGIKTTFKIKHIMTDKYIYGINDIGIKIVYDEKHQF